jgi:hypothetical protein
VSPFPCIIHPVLLPGTTLGVAYFSSSHELFRADSDPPVVFATRIEMNTASPFSQIPYALSYNGFRSRMFNVLGYAPQAGQSGTTVTIDTLFNNWNWRHDVHIRIVIGNKPIHTEIKGLGGSIPNLWRCTGFVPEFEVHKNSSFHSVNVTIQAVDKRNAVLDTVTIGRFTYQEHGKRRIIYLFRAPSF